MEAGAACVQRTRLGRDGGFRRQLIAVRLQFRAIWRAQTARSGPVRPALACQTSIDHYGRGQRAPGTVAGTQHVRFSRRRLTADIESTQSRLPQGHAGLSFDD